MSTSNLPPNEPPIPFGELPGLPPADRVVTDAAAVRLDRGLTSGKRLPPSAYDPPTTRWTRATRATTGLAMRTLEAVIGTRIRVTGAEELGEGPILFVANHFTRMETFILPYLLWMRTRRHVHSLAWHGFFGGMFGRYLLAMGARPTRDPAIRHGMVEDLMTGRHDWLIYPEGSLVKDKRMWRDGRLEIDVPDRRGPPHAGAAIMALKALLYRDGYLNAVASGDRELQRRWEERYHLAGPSDLSRVPLRVVPVGITYYPLRPEPNLISRLAGRVLRNLPEGLLEELTIEGHLLLHRTDMAVHIGRPVPLDRYVARLREDSQVHGDFSGELARTAHVIDGLKAGLTRRMMFEVYRHLEISLDHLFCSALRHLRRDTVRVRDLHRAIYLAARSLQSCGDHRTHASLGPDLVDLVVGTTCPALDSVVKLATAEGILVREDGPEPLYRINRVALEHTAGFHDVRLSNMVAVIANELEPVRTAIRLIRTLVNQPGGVLARQVARLLTREALVDAVRERALTTPTVPEDSALPRLLQAPGARLAVVLVHGYMASPGEVMPLAHHLHSRGFTVIVPRLAGHGSSPDQLKLIDRADWSRSVRRALAHALALCPAAVVAGFSTGGLLALRLAGDCPSGVAGAVSLNAPLRLHDWRASLAPLVDRSNRWLARLGLPRLDLVKGEPDFRDTNYDRNPVHALAELMRLVREFRRKPPLLHCPALLLQSDRDEVVRPDSAERLARLVGGEARAEAIARARHVCLRGDGAPEVWERVAEFCAHTAAHLSTPPRRQWRTPLPLPA